MPMFGVMRETFESDGGSMSGDEDFFSVARTMPFVAIQVSSSKAAGSLVSLLYLLCPEM